MPLAGFVAGAAWQLRATTLVPGAVSAALLVLGLGLALGLFGRQSTARRCGRRASVFWLVAAMLVGFGLTGWRASAFQASTLDPSLEGVDIELVGQVSAMPQITPEGVRFKFDVASAQRLLVFGEPVTVSVPPAILVGWYGPRDAAAADVDEELLSDLVLQRRPQTMRAGERWRLTVRLKAPHGSSNPFGFDYELWMWEQGLQANGAVRAGKGDTPPQRLSDSGSHPIERARQSVREAIYARIDDRRMAGLLAALVVGDQNAIGRADWEVFRTTGVAHLMSISGLHITMFAWLASRLIAALWRRSARWSPRLCLWLPAAAAGAWGGLALAVLYALFSGWGVPAQRTVLMLATLMVLRQSARQWPWWLAWLSAMAAVVALDPWALMQAGFWLSFVAVGVLFATGSEAPSAEALPPPVATSRLAALAVSCRRLATRMGHGLKEQWVVTLALTPLSLLLFNQVSLVGLLANALAIPWVTLVVTPLAMAGVVWAPVWEAAAWTASVLTTLLQWLAAWPMASLSVASAPVVVAAAGVLGGALIATRWPWPWKTLGLPLLLPVLLWQPSPVPPGQFEFLAADIGQGNAVLVRTASHALLYDTGPVLSPDSDAGQRVLVPLLRALGVRLDRLVLSHRDSDHIGGAPAVLAMQPQADVWSSIEREHPLQALRPVTRCMAGQRWVWDEVEFRILQPPAEAYDTPQKPNAVSCVLRISNGTQTALLVGDIEAPQELALVNAEAAKGTHDLAADFLLAPHHGSKTSSTETFLKAVSPRWSLAQAGYRNRFGHPALPVVERYAVLGLPLARSASCGAATWRSVEPGVLACQRDTARRYWHHLMPADIGAGG